MALLIGSQASASACEPADCGPMVLPSGQIQLQIGSAKTKGAATRQERPRGTLATASASRTSVPSVESAPLAAPPAVAAVLPSDRPDATTDALPSHTPPDATTAKVVALATPDPVPAAESPAKPGPKPQAAKTKASRVIKPEVVAVAPPADPPPPAAARTEVVTGETTAATAAPTPAKPARKAKVKAEPPTGPKGIEIPATEPTGVAGYRTDLESLKPIEVKVTPKSGVPTSLAAAVRTAISDNALIKVSEGGALDALAGIDVASAGLYPQVDGRIAGGTSGTGDWQANRGYPYRTAYFNRKNAYGAARGDVSLSAQQTIFDFGATRSGISRAAAATEAQNFSVLQTIEDVAFKTAESYLKVLQERELVDLSGENLDSLKEIADLVSENQKNGNGTVADVKRVNARVIDAASSAADESLALKLASDQLRRLIRVDPGQLGPAPSLSAILPGDETKALSLAETTNPGILAYKASIQSRENEIASIRGGRLPKLTAEISASNKQYQAVNDKTQFDGSAMLGLSYKFYDGGLAAAQVEQDRARMLQDEMRMRDARETIESVHRQNYFTIKIARDKNRSLAEGVDLNAKARALYREQFRGGKRSLLELLEVQQAYYLARRTQITNQFDERRASYLILRSLGRFAVAALRTR